MNGGRGDRRESGRGGGIDGGRGARRSGGIEGGRGIGGGCGRGAGMEGGREGGRGSGRGGGRGIGRGGRRGGRIGEVKHWGVVETDLRRKYLNKLSSSGLPPSEVAVFLRNVVKIMNELLRRFPSCYADLPVSDLYCGTRMLYDKGQLADGALVTEVDEIMKLRIEKAEELKRKGRRKAKKKEASQSC
ncbi:hypothetical protein ACROYT_G005685 [Oculina patagonica]